MYEETHKRNTDKHTLNLSEKSWDFVKNEAIIESDSLGCDVCSLWIHGDVILDMDPCLNTKVWWYGCWVYSIMWALY